MKPIILFTFCFCSINVFGQLRIEKIGAFTGIHRITSSYNNYKHGNFIKKSRILVNKRLGAKIALPLVSRLSLEGGVLMDNTMYKNKDENPSCFIFLEDNSMASNNIL